jgi:hypothetical protein
VTSTFLAAADSGMQAKRLGIAIKTSVSTLALLARADLKTEATTHFNSSDINDAIAGVGDETAAKLKNIMREFDRHRTGTANVAKSKGKAKTSTKKKSEKKQKGGDDKKDKAKSTKKTSSKKRKADESSAAADSEEKPAKKKKRKSTKSETA